jgi:hypothetical protein
MNAGDGCPGARMTSLAGLHVKEGCVKQSQAVSVRRPRRLALLSLSSLPLAFWVATETPFSDPRVAKTLAEIPIHPSDL